MDNFILEKIREIPAENRRFHCPICGSIHSKIVGAKHCFEQCARDCVSEQSAEEYICEECFSVYDSESDACDCAKSHFIPLSDKKEAYFYLDEDVLTCEMCENHRTQSCPSFAKGEKKDANNFCLCFVAEKINYALFQSVFECNKRIYLGK